MKLKDKVAIITGGTAGIGAATAIRFVQEGAKVVITGRSAEKAEKTLKELEALGGEAVYVQADVSKEADIDKVVETTVEKFGKIDIVFNNAGMEGGGDLAQYDMDSFDKTMNLNLRGVVYMCKKTIPYLIETKGTIINNSSCTALKTIHGCYAYCASKSAVVAFTKVIALDYAHLGVRANCLCPGMVRTDLLGTQTEEFLAHIEQGIPFKRMAEPSEMASVVAFMASDDASYLTGQAIAVEGGLLLP
ncbi:MAG: SDR family oxidoreductase [Firmicutes bacterium]|nr:SDR family oxidoreductase [Bacillota bacterium]